jgi:hypothetical protein
MDRIHLQFQVKFDKKNKINNKKIYGIIKIKKSLKELVKYDIFSFICYFKRCQYIYNNKMINAVLNRNLN